MTLAGANIPGCVSASLFSYQIDRIIGADWLPVCARAGTVGYKF
jgi:hypothetical protein